MIENDDNIENDDLGKIMIENDNLEKIVINLDVVGSSFVQWGDSTVALDQESLVTKYSSDNYNFDKILEFIM